jgi:hypothetical protein
LPAAATDAERRGGRLRHPDEPVAASLDLAVESAAAISSLAPYVTAATWQVDRSLPEG